MDQDWIGGMMLCIENAPVGTTLFIHLFNDK